MAKTCARKGAKNILMLNRQSQRATDAEKEVRDASDPSKTSVVTIPCDLQDFESVDQAIQIVKAKYDAIDVLCNNAGVMAMEDKATKDGFDVQMQTNHLSHFKLVKELYPLLQEAVKLRGQARVVHHSSIARHGGPLKPEYFEKRGGDLGGDGSSMFLGGARWERYHQTKLANSVFTAALKEKLEGTGILATVAAPGIAKTNLQTTSAAAGAMSGNMWVMYLSQSAEDGTMPILSACFDPECKNGDMYEPSGFQNFSGPSTKVPYDKQTANPDNATLLWKKSEEAVGKFDI